MLESQGMMIPLLLLLLPSVCRSITYTEYYYGTTYQIPLTERAHFVEFTSTGGSEMIILWTRDNPWATKGGEWRRRSSYLERDLTFGDSGYYVVRDTYRKRLHTEQIKVVAIRKTLELNMNSNFVFKADLDSSSCNIYFTPEGEEEILIVHQGQTKYEFYNSGCEYLERLNGCEISNQVLQLSCNGRYTFRNNEDETLMVMTVNIERIEEVPTYLVVIVFIVVVFIVLCCVIRCCFEKLKRGKNTAQSAAAPEPVVNYREYVHEPTRRTQNQPSEPSRNPRVTQPFWTSPLTHGSLPLDNPPSYAEISPRIPPPPITSEPAFRFEVKGANSDLNAPLHTDPTSSDVYTSDKLNFL